MSDSLQRAPVGVRVAVKQGELVAIFARPLRAVPAGGWSFDIAVREMTRAELLPGALASDVIGLFMDLARAVACRRHGGCLPLFG